MSIKDIQREKNLVCIRWDKPTHDKVDTETEKLARPKEARK
jgi:hypothetical protein